MTVFLHYVFFFKAFNFYVIFMPAALNNVVQVLYVKECFNKINE